MKQPLAIVGASTRSAAASAVRAGFQPLAADLFGDVDLRRIATTTQIRPYPEGFLDWIRTVEPQAWMYTGALENYPELVDQMAWMAPLLGNPGDVLARVRSPWELGDVLTRAGLLFPETRESGTGLPRDGSWLTKTYRGASGSGVRTFGQDKGVQLGEQSKGEQFCFQKRVKGTPCAAIYVASASVVQLLGVTRQIIGESWVHAHGFQYAGSIGCWPISEASRATLAHLGNVLAEQFELAGLFGVDFMLDDEQVWTIEVNPRYTASVEIVERCTGVKAISAHVAAFSETAGKLPLTAGSFDRVDCKCHGKATLFATRDVGISDEFADYTIEYSQAVPWPLIGDVSAGGTMIENGRPVLTVFASGMDVAEVERNLRQRVTEAECKLYGYGH